MTKTASTGALVLLLLCLATANPAAQEDADRPGWLYATGTGTAAAEVEAKRLAKANAIGAVFRDLGKDTLFQRMFLSDWPEAVEVDSQTIEGDDETGFTAEVRVAIDQNAVILAEGPYNAAATGLLNRAEALLEEADAAVRRAANEESELEVQKAFGSYHRAESLVGEIRILLSPVGDDSVFSDGGANLSALLTTSDGIEATVAAGLGRIEKLAAEIETEQGRRQHQETLARIEERLGRADEAIRRHVPNSPFYDLPVEKLESIKGELTTTVADLQSIVENLKSLETTIGDAGEMARRRVDLALETTRGLLDHGRRMLGEVEREIAYPRLERQEDEARRARRKKALGRAARWTFLHRPMDYLSYSVDLPFLVDHRDGSDTRRPAEWQLAAEASFRPGIWLHAELSRQLDGGAYGVYRSAVHQEVGIGLVAKRIWGVGFGWDWGAFAGEERETALTADSTASFYLGRPSQALRRADILFSLTYRLPRYFDSLVVPYHVNGKLEATFRLEQILIVEGMVRSDVVSTDRESTDVPTEDSILGQPYVFEWTAGVGFRLPPPFILRVRYGETRERTAGERESPLDLVRRGWSFALGYTI